MAKLKTYMVEVELTVKRTYFVEARRPNGAVEKLQTVEGWREANRYEDDDVHREISPTNPKQMHIVRVKDRNDL